MRRYYVRMSFVVMLIHYVKFDQTAYTSFKICGCWEGDLAYTHVHMSVMYVCMCICLYFCVCEYVFVPPSSGVDSN